MSQLQTRILLAASALLLGSIPGLSVAQTNVNACQAQAANLIDEWFHSPGGGDKDFFTMETAAPPNILFLIDNSGSMRRMVRDISSNGCSDPFYLGLPYDPADTYPDFHPTGHPVPDEPGSCSLGGFSGLYKKGEVYWPRNTTLSERVSGTISGACDNWSGDTRTECINCLQDHGFYRNGSRQYFDGNLLNVFPPRYVMARRAVTEAIYFSRDIRMGLTIFDWGDRTAKWIGTGVCGSSFNPPCNQAFPTGTNAFYENRSSCVGAVNNLTRSDFSTGTPLANALLTVGQYFNNADDMYTQWGFPTKSAFTSADSDNQRSMCWGCQLNAVVVITDGEPWRDNDPNLIPAEIRNLDGSVHPRLDCPDCGNDTYYGSDRPNLLHKVAYWLRNRNVNNHWENNNHIYTYTVGFAIDFPLLERTAELGGGRYFPATDAETLRDALDNIVEDMLERSSTFSTTTLSNIQAQAVQSVLIPKFLPQREGPWPGELFRFDFLSEFIIEMDLSGDGSESGFYLVDSDCTVPATGEDLDWDAIRAGDAEVPEGCVPIREATEAEVDEDPTFELGRFYKTTDFDDDTLTTDLAKPFWEANEELLDRNPLGRNVYTFIDTSDDGQLERIHFHPTNVTDLLPYLALNAGSFCKEMSAELEDDLDHEDCGKILIRYVLGCEHPLTLAEIDSTTCTPRANILGDIFHSPPTIVEPPTPAGLMETPFRHDQSPWTLVYDEYFKSDTEEDDQNAYGEFAKEHEERSRVALVGSNGGMMHAFHAGSFIERNGFDIRYDRGTGEELWAVIPTTLLPRLRHMPPQIGEAYTHRYYVDGHPWVRNIWVDGLGDEGEIDHKRQPGEFRTVAVMSLRQGGNRWFALDVTDLDDPHYEPDLLWTFPEVGSPLELFVGQSWSDVQPKPPPIGPIRYKSDSSPAPEYHGESWRERWIVTIPGGHDSRHLRGRGWYMLDVYTGEMLWEFYHPDKGESGVPDDDPRWSLAYSFAAPPTLVAWGDQISHTFGNAYFDTLVVGDTGGQLWLGRFGNPDPDEWHGARMFEPTAHSATDSNDKVHWHPPFYQSAHFTLIPESGLLRAYLGSGDRANLREPGGGICSPDNLAACVRSGTCELEEIHLHNLDLDSARNHFRYESDDVGERIIQVKDPRRNLAELSTDVCPELKVGSFKIVMSKCRDYENKQVPKFEMDGSITCEHDADRLVYDCTDEDDTDQHRWRWQLKSGSIDSLACTDTTRGQPDRFYSIRVFGGHEDLVPFNSRDEAIDFDKARQTTGTEQHHVLRANPEAGDPPPISSSGPGWYYEYDMVSERTASAAVTAGPCVVWSSLEASRANLSCPGVATTEESHPLCPPSGSVACPCTDGGAEQESFMYFRNYLTGANDCLAYPPTGWQEAQGRISIGQEPQPPPAPQVMTQVTGAGQVRTSIVTTEDSVDIGDSEDLVQDFAVIDIPLDLHMWRHAACEGERCH